MICICQLNVLVLCCTMSVIIACMLRVVMLQ